MKPQRPYLLRALYDWIVDSGEVPFIVVDAQVEGVVVPTEHVENGQIVLNLGPNAVRDLQLGDEYVMCSGRFSGVAMELAVPVHAIRAIYARDTGAGMAFPEESGPEGPGPDGPNDDGPTPPDPDQGPGGDKPDDSGDKPGGKPGLRVVS